MEKFTREFLNQPGNEDLSDEEFHLKLGEYMERRGRAATPTAPMETASAPPRSIGMFMPSTVPELRGRDNLPTFCSASERGLLLVAVIRHLTLK